MTVLFGISLAAAIGGVEALADEAERESESRHSIGGRDNAIVTTESKEAYGALATSGARDATDTRGGASTASQGAAMSKPGNFNFWFYEADVILFNDDDADGFYHGIDLLFDVDTNFASADVYAVLYLSLDGGPWNEYGITDDFTIFGTSATDEYVMVTELMSGYPTGSYDLLIELFDAYDGDFLAGFGPADTSELAYLPLEDFNRDAPAPEVQVVVNEGSSGGGAIDGWFIAMFLAVLFASGVRRIWRHRNDSLMRIDTPASCWQDHLGNRQ
jgi:hypothetical protein